jgi:copper resistance protein B
VLGLQGLAPYWIEVDAALFLSDKGDMTARLEAEYDFRITQKLILQPRAELELSAQKVPELDLGSGITKAEVGVRLRYEIRPELAPYVGIEYERALSATAELKRLGGEEPGDWFLTVGVRTWF